MTLASPTVTVYFGSDFNESAFTLNDTTKGELDGATYTLGGDTGTDISADVMSITINRGRSSEQSDFNSGVCTIELQDPDHIYSPVYAFGGGPYVGQLTPGKRVTVEMYGQVLFEGVTENWIGFDDPDGASTAQMSSHDALGSLGRMELSSFTASNGQTADERLTSVLNRSEVNFPFNRDFDDGISPLQGDVVPEGTNVVSYCQLVAESDFGYFFASRQNVLTFRSRYHSGTVFVDFNDDPGDWRDDSGPLSYLIGPFRSYEGTDPSDRLINRVSVTIAGGTTQTVDDTTAQDQYGVRALSFDGLLLQSDTLARSMAEYVLELYKDPVHRIDSVTVNVSAITAQGFTAAPAARVDIGDTIEVSISGVNGPGTTNEYRVEGVDHQIVVGGPHMMTIYLTQFARVGFILDSAGQGFLDDTHCRLGY